MRKYLAVAALGAMLIAGQAAASDSAVVSANDRVGSQSAASDSLEGANLPLALIAGAIFAGLVGFAISQNGDGSHPISP